MTAAESRREDRWPDMLERWLRTAPGTAVMPSVDLFAHGAVPSLSLSMPSHGANVPPDADGRTWKGFTR